jgi:hypothetical protein
MKTTTCALCLLVAATLHAEAKPGGRQKKPKGESGAARQERVEGLQTGSLQPSSGLTASTSLRRELSDEEWRNLFLRGRSTANNNENIPDHPHPHRRSFAPCLRSSAARAAA